MEQRERTHVLSSVVEFDDAYLDGQKKGGKGGRETEKAKIFVTLSLNLSLIHISEPTRH